MCVAYDGTQFFREFLGYIYKKMILKLNFFLFSHVHRNNSSFVKRVFEDEDNDKSVELNTALFIFCFKSQKRM